MRTTFFAIALILFLAACSTQEYPILKSTNDNLLGNWINIEYGDTTFTVQKASELPTDQYCFSFEANGKFIENKNSGWCGTPPIAYDVFEGTWQLSDSIITIETPYWGGTSVYTWKLLSIDESTLKIWIIDQQFTIEEE